MLFFMCFADIVVLVGDLTDGPVKKLHAAASPLKDIQSKYGSFYVTGEIVFIELQYSCTINNNSGLND